MSDTPLSAVVFCAGFGTRMRHLVRDVPKPMVEVGGRPMVDRAIDLLREAGITTVHANTHHHADRIEPHLAALGVTSHRETPRILDTGGGLKAMAPHLPEAPVITLNPDAAWRGPNPVAQLLKAWRPEMECLMLLVPLDRTGREAPGDFAFDGTRISRKGDFVFTGAQIIRPDLVADVEDEVFSLNVVWDRLIAAGGVHAVVYDGAWHDIGTPEGVKRIEELGAHGVRA